MANLRKGTALFMAVWLSGFLFLITCHAQPEKTFSCPLMKLGAHCGLAEKEKNAERITKQTTDDGSDCCAFIPAFFDKTRTNDVQPTTVIAAPVAVIEQPKLIYFRPNCAPVNSYSSVLPLRNDTFLKNRTFRI
jgi:hypothetical protein